MSSSDVGPGSPDRPASLGARLRAAREARGLGIEQAATALRARQSIIEAIEADDFERLGAPVFARGYLTSYARLVGLPTVVVDAELARHVQPPEPLRTSVRVSRTRHLMDRYARRGAYLVLTASIVVPLVIVATRDQLPMQELGLRSLDAPLQPLDRSRVAERPSEQQSAAAPAAGPEQEADEDVTVMASLTPFYNQRPATRPSEAAADESGWLLRTEQDSWVEITDVDGKRLEYGLLRAGDERRYPAGRVATVALGNASGVTLLRDGEAIDLAPFQRANVARFTVSSDGLLRPGS